MSGPDCRTAPRAIRVGLILLGVILALLAEPPTTSTMATSLVTATPVVTARPITLRPGQGITPNCANGLIHTSDDLGNETIGCALTPYPQTSADGEPMAYGVQTTRQTNLTFETLDGGGNVVRTDTFDEPPGMWVYTDPAVPTPGAANFLEVTADRPITAWVYRAVPTPTVTPATGA